MSHGGPDDCLRIQICHWEILSINILVGRGIQSKEIVFPKCLKLLGTSIIR